MLNKIKNLILVAAMGSSMLVPALVPVAMSTASADIQSNLCKGVNNAAQGTQDTSCGNAGKNGDTDLSKVAGQIVNVFSIIVGIVAVIMIIYGGFRYITSGGDSGKVGNAKNSLIYAIVGLIIVALAQIIVHYVLNTTANATSGLS
jgi:hypothetical protein